ncbi:MAG: FkbM family methyltransferase [Dysgonomonas sp.]|nr:FkbM family methyltransferase [Dysgonomonas sp.]
MNFERATSIFDYYLNYKRIKKRWKKDNRPFKPDTFWELRKDILSYYERSKPKDKELKEAVNYIRKKGVEIFPHSLNEKYNNQNITVYTDEQSNLKYVKHNGHNLYFPADMKDIEVITSYGWLSVEQDISSPHRYLTKEFDVNKNDVFLDIGAAEGILSLDVVDKVHKIILFEVEDRWIEALSKTFEPWKDKVTIINKYVSDRDSDTTIKIDSLTDMFDSNSIFLKLDVEGAEAQVLKGAEMVLTSGKYDCKAIVCTYHKQEDFENLSAIMEKYKYEIEPSYGYMLFIHDPVLTEPYLRKGLIRCRR